MARILVIDDEPEFGNFVRNVGEGLGHAVTVTSEATAFKRAYNGDNPDYIVLDMVMPEVEGIELLQWLIDRKCQAKVVVVTGYNPQYAEMAKVLGGAMGLDIAKYTKPIRIKDLRAALGGEAG